MGTFELNRFTYKNRLGSGRNPIKYALFFLAAGFMIGSTLAGCSHLHSENGSDAGAMTAAIDFYRGPLDHLNAVRTGSCPMHPGCSDYCRQAIERHGPIIGWIIACDRLMRCGRDELDRCPRILINGEPRCFDPLIRNDWWWHDSGLIGTPYLYSARAWKISID